ncbi:MAG: cobalamin-binding protein [Jaaginema sp. PMC 1079.18]|nr:cobalamin-binding protein [Jaaginema sp. PMC 1080.18]MEC4849859.1 cobalamin-binding protein [Jaaginema sp. PMC 1079.18]MEC4865247.1 cobalamin-binding protein [Jaaginema sp. PMC 1078.18]
MSNNTELRIISLLPGATECVAALGLVDSLVGRSHECDYPPAVRDLPVCTSARLNSDRPSAEIDRDVKQLIEQALSIYQLDLDAIADLQPTHILTQDQCDVCAVSLAEVEAGLREIAGIQPQVISLQPIIFEEIWTDLERLAKAFGVSPQPTLGKLQKRADACVEKTQNLPIPTVVALEWLDPLMSAGSWLPELIAMAGGECLLAEPGKTSPYLSWDALINTDPDVIVMMPCGFDLPRTRTEAAFIPQHPGWQKLQAVQKGRVYITDGNAYFNRPGPRLVDSVEIMAEILHPTQFGSTYQGKAWEKFS